MPNGEQGEKEGTDRRDRWGSESEGTRRKGRKEGDGEGRKLTKLKGIFSKQDHRNVIDRLWKSWTVMASCYPRIFFAAFSTSKTWCIVL